MMKKNTQRILRNLWLCLMLLLSIDMHALVYDRSDKTYAIVSKDDFLKNVVKNSDNWGRKLKLMCDIDLDGEKPITPIGNKSKMFSGQFDGQGFKISNFKILWDDRDDNQGNVFGLFGAVSGTSNTSAIVKNLVIENAHITRSKSSPFADQDIRLSILAAYVNNYVKIHDICILDSKIDDGSHAAGTNGVKGIYCGGAFGDMASSIGGTSEISYDSNKFQFFNIYIDVDFDFSETEPQTKQDAIVQFYVGGVGGRIRSAKDKNLVPKNTLYTGTIKIPQGSSSPTVSNMRSTSELACNTALRTYHGEIGSNTLRAQFSSDAEFDSYCAARMFYNYSSYNSKKSADEAITDTYPDPNAEYYEYKGMRTFLPNKGATLNLNIKTPADQANYTPAHWAYLQGVNFGKLLNIQSESADVVGMFNTAVSDKLDDGNKKFSWLWDAANKRFMLERNFDPTKEIYVFIDIKENGDYEANVKYEGFELAVPYAGDGVYQWYKASRIEDGEWSLISGANSSAITPEPDQYYYFTWTYDGYTLRSDYKAPKRMIYVYDKDKTTWYNDHMNGSWAFHFDTDTYSIDGDDANNGLTPSTAVKTITRAYELLDASGDVSTNQIVVMGYLEPTDFMLSKTNTHEYDKPATISGSDQKGITDGVLGIFNGASSSNNAYLYLHAPLRFVNIALRHSYYKIDATGINDKDNNAGIACNCFDLTIDDNVTLIRFPGINKKEKIGLPGNITTVPFFTIVAGYMDYNEASLIYPSDTYPQETMPQKRGYYSEPGRVNITIRSGCFARVICAGRNSVANNIAKNILGSYDKPYRATVNINFQNDIDFANGGGRHVSQYGIAEVPNADKKTYHYEYSGFTHNIGLLSGGQTDGSVYGDIEVNIYSGYLARVITGNISYGRNIAQNPSDSYFGRSIINIYGKTQRDASGKTLSETTINEIFGGNLGRLSDKNNIFQPYYYGQSIINMYGGHVGAYTGRNIVDERLDELRKLDGNLYGAGSGGTTGLGDVTNHTCDPHIPYLNGTNVAYSPFDASKEMPKMTMGDGTVIDLAKTSCHINMYSGVVDGSVFGAGYGYSNNIDHESIDLDPQKKVLNEDIGKLFGDAYVTMYDHPDFMPPMVLGNVYGSGAGDATYAKYKKNHPDWSSPNTFTTVASHYGDTHLVLEGGSVGDPRNNTGGDVYGGARGVPGYPDIAALYGTANIEVNGTTIYGNIYGGSGLANIRQVDGVEGSGNVNLTVRSGIIGNNIFGGSEGDDDNKTIIDGDVYVKVEGGDFIDHPYLDFNQSDTIVDPATQNLVLTPEKYRTFNIYGGGNINCDVNGTAHVDVSSSLMLHESSFVPRSQNPNAIDKYVETERFQSAYMDLTYRRFSVYGGGFGEKTIVGNTDVHVTIPPERAGVTLPHGFTLSAFLPHQSFFDIAGGGYSGDVGYWATKEGTPVHKIDFSVAPYNTMNETERAKLYDHYVGGHCHLVIDGYTYARKVIGGGFYGSCRSTETYVKCGSLRQVYGGSLLGYVHDKAFLQFGNRIEDFMGKDGDVYVFDLEGKGWDGNDQAAQATAADEWARAALYAKELNQYIYITENIYGGNDVKGIIGTKKWEGPGSTATDPVYGIDLDGGPLYQTDINDTEEKGIVFNIYGGTFMGDVYGAGNGHYRGYYVPGWIRYEDGPARMYRTLNHDHHGKKTVYRSRPMVGSVNLNIRGNSADDMVQMRGNLFGGGRECTIGQFNTKLPMEDPRRLAQGGFLHINFGGYTNIDGNVYMGAEGRLYGNQQLIPTESNISDLKTFDGRTSAGLELLGDAAYDHWYYDTDKECYLPGYPAPGKVDGNFGMTGEHMLYGYMQNVQVQGDTELTFYRHLYKRDANGNNVYEMDGSNNAKLDANGKKLRVRKRWVPGEIAINDYDAVDVKINSFYLGGLSGSMSNNNLMAYCYTTGTAIDPNVDAIEGHKHELYGSIYRITLPKGLTVRDKVVMGSENATIKIYPYNDTYTGIVTTKDVVEEIDGNTVTVTQDIDPTYVYEGGLITQHTFSFDLLAYNDEYNKSINVVHDLPSNFYTDSQYADIRKASSWTLKNGPYAGSGNNVTIYRKNYAYQNADDDIKADRYGLAAANDAGTTAYIGLRDKRRENENGTSDNKKTVSKLTAACVFDQASDNIYTAPEDVQKNYYGGNIYGGCYNSGIVIGDVVLNVGSNLLGKTVDVESAESFGEISSLKYNIGRVFGGGFGRDTRIEGDTYVNLLRNFKGMNVFGGGMQGDVTGTAHVTYIGSELQSYVLGSIYGGGLQGNIGTPGETEQSTVLRLFSGNVANVYGGSCMGNLYGRASVELCDEVIGGLDHLDYQLLKESLDDWGGSRLIAGNVYAGNDIAGNIVPKEDCDSASVSVYMHEIQMKNASPAPGASHENVGPGKTSPGSHNGYNGFPLVGDLYGASNGDYGGHGSDNKYLSGTVDIANGIGAQYMTINLAGQEVPHVETSHIRLEGGTVINAYGGGNLSTVTDSAKISMLYPEESFGARAGFETEAELDRVWKVLKFTSAEQRGEVTKKVDDHPIFDFQVFRLFGGNNNADMDIQPTWTLGGGYVGSLYSGGNFGKMTVKGLKLTLDSDNMHVDNVYGGARVGNIEPKEVTDADVANGFYGATLNIKRGVIEHVYGGNDVSGFVEHGTHVKIEGAISGDVYCAGNGNYLYQYDRDGQLYDYDDTRNLHVREVYDEATGLRYFQLPASADYGFAKGVEYEATPAQTVLAINSYRPHVERSLMEIRGSKTEISGQDPKINQVWVKGNVYCGGNSATVYSSSEESSVQFSIGNYVKLNGVFLGSNGEGLANGVNVERLEALNDISMLADNDLESATIISTLDATARDKTLYPHLLDLYMRAVEINNPPKDFSLSEDLEDAYIGDFCVGGNRGSMMTTKPIRLTFPSKLVIYNSIIGGCKAAKYSYGGERGVTHVGGLTAPLADTEKAKVQLEVHSKFEPLALIFDNDVPKLEPQLVDGRYPDGICNIYGGCYTSGRTVGDINIDVYSDMLQYDTADPINKRAVVDGMTDNVVRRNFTVIGGGYGADTEVYGNIRVRMLPTAPPAGRAVSDISHPSAATIFGGAQEGVVVGHTQVEIRDGKILGNVYGASEAATMYGSTAVIVGYPKYYKVKDGKSGVFALNRSDYYSDAARQNKKRANGKYAMVKTVAYREGEIVPSNVYDIMIGRVKDDIANGTATTNHDNKAFEIGMEVESDANDQWMWFFTSTDATADKTKTIGTYFDEQQELPSDFGVNWDDIEIWIGDQTAVEDTNNPYYGQGNIYGGGYIPNNSNQSLTNKNTVLRFTSEYHPEGMTVAEGQKSIYGGNTVVSIWDNAENASWTNDNGNYKYLEKASDDSDIKDHVSVGTCHYIPVAYTANGDKRGYYVKSTDTHDHTIFVYQSSGKMDPGTTYYIKEADGGVYGGGRKVFVEGFSGVDLAYYGYVNHSPQHPKLLNTIQRSDLVTVTDCCIELVGAEDFTGTGFEGTLYSINRVDELRMVSSLSGDMDLVGRTVQADDNLLLYTQPRSRNYIGFYHSVNDLASFYSNWTMERKYHDEYGKVTKKKAGYKDNGDTRIYTWRNQDEPSVKTDITTDIIAKYGAKSDGDADYMQSYTLYKHDIIEDYFDIKYAGGIITEPEAEVQERFNKRNVGTSGNMIGINSGFSLVIQGSCKAEETSTQDETYYGPIYGITEMKLLTVAKDEGGGYVYALNHHYDKDVDAAQLWQETPTWMQEWGHDFYMVSGNFVFPGAAYESNEKHNYIVDDCMPFGHGYEEYMREYQTAHSKLNGFDVNTCPGAEQHYWYVSGTIFQYNVTVTGITSDDRQHFYLNNEDDLVNLMGLSPDAKIKLESVTWFNHAAGECGSDGCAINDTTLPYRLYFTIDHNTRNTYYESGNGAYVLPIPRSDFSWSPTPTYADQTVQKRVDGDGQTFNPDYSTGYATVGETPNVPRLGIRLEDNNKSRFKDQDVSVGRQYYEARLKSPHRLQVRLKAMNKNGVDGGGNPTYDEVNEFTYIVDVTIKYLLGPMVNGKVDIENCALPGEYIYVAANDITVDMDESNLGVTDQFFKLYPHGADGKRIQDNNGIDISYKINAQDDAEYADYVVANNQRLLHIPAYYYMDGWEVSYGVEVGGADFEVSDPGDGSNLLEVHNYHRMKPVCTDGSVLDLRLVPGARVYIEDDADEKYFFEYLAAHQDDEPEVKHGVPVNPRYGAGVNFIQRADVTIPASVSLPADVSQIRFEGNYHGDGHIVTIPESVSLNFVNAGRFYNTGFKSLVNADVTKVFSENHGSLYNCFYHNKYSKGSFLGTGAKSLADGHHIANCYQNTGTMASVSALGYKYNELMPLSSLGFIYGQAAYNLNGFYLQKRHLLLHGSTANPLPTTIENNSFALKQRDLDLRSGNGFGATDTYDDYAVGYVEDYYKDGEYRYASYSAEGAATALRTRVKPNYRDELGNRSSGLPLSMHNAEHPVDESRWCVVREPNSHNCYHPIFEEDYIFFGEDLTVDVTDDSEVLPGHVTPETRVYRVGGFYGSASDKGYFFNRVAWLDSPLMTAVDFTGFRDKALYDATGMLKADDRADIADNGWVIKASADQPVAERTIGGFQEAYYPPMLDLPWRMDKINGVDMPVHDFYDVTVNSDIVTNNLLIYTRNNDHASEYMSDFHYENGLTGNNYQYHDESNIRAHHIVVDEDGSAHMYGGYFHLKDGHAFNAPLAFDVEQGWYTRKPKLYADDYTETIEGVETVNYKTAWEGVYLPYTVGVTYAATTDMNVFKEDMGEITHFFGKDENDENDKKGHEYWLRRLTGYDKERKELTFERPYPTATSPHTEDVVGNKRYSNTALYRLYENKEYNPDHDKLYHFEEGKGQYRTIENYRYLTGGVPYIVTFPGRRYYEFDLSGQFYAEVANTDPAKPLTAVPQTIIYNAKADAQGHVVIPVTDELSQISYTAGGYTMRGTFQHVTNNSTQAGNSVLYDHVDNLYVLDEANPVDRSAEGTEFKKASANTVVEPFHVYIVAPSASKAPLRISGDRTSGIVTPEVVPDEPEQPAEEEAVAGIEVWTQDGALYIRTPYDTQLYIHNMLGQAVRHIRAYQGLNRYTGLTPAIYIVAGHKVKI